MCLKKLILLVAIVCIGMFYSNIIFAESLEDLTTNFNIDTIEKDVFQRYSKAEGLLGAYLICTAAVRGDQTVCDDLNSDEARFCSKQFSSMHNFYRELVTTGTVTSKAIESCMQTENGVTSQDCRDLAEAFISKDASICEVSECSAIIKRDVGSCKEDKGCRDRVYYIKAVEKNNAKSCDKIKDESLRMLCMGSITLDEKICKQCSGFKKFIERYHEDLIKMEVGDEEENQATQD